jgi:rhodanese-related sulfurtransferase
MRLGRIGFDRVVGYLEGGAQALHARPDLVRRITRITATGLAAELGGTQPPLVLDVRGPGERVAKHIAGSLHIPLPHLAAQLHTLPRDRTVVLQCAGGYRSAIAASVLAQHGMTAMADLVGGLAAWEAAGLDLAAATV